jgi:hypothetical protein
MNKLARISYGITVILLAILGVHFVFAEGCCYVKSGTPRCEQFYEFDQSTCLQEPGNIYSTDNTCGDIEECQEVCCCEGSVDHYTILGECQERGLSSIQTNAVGCTEYCSGTPLCNQNCIVNTNKCVYKSGVFYPPPNVYYCWEDDTSFFDQAICQSECGTFQTCTSSGGVCGAQESCVGTSKISYDSDCSPNFCCESTTVPYSECCQPSEECQGTLLTGNYRFCSKPCSGTCSSTTPEGTISGYVYDTNTSGRIDGARVYGVLTSNPSVEVASTSSVSGGTYSLDLPYGTYRIYAQKDGYATSYIDATVTGTLSGRNIGLNPSAIGVCQSKTPPAPLIAAAPVKGKAEVSLSWTVDCTNIRYFSITKKLKGGQTSGEFRTDKLSYLDTDVEWGQTYVYSIQAFYDTDVYSGFNEIEITLGNALCEGKFGDEEFCLDSMQMVSLINTVRYRCLDDNSLDPIVDCSQVWVDGTCVGPDENDKTKCVYTPLDCKQIEPFRPFGLYYAQDTCLADDEQWCYYDASDTTVDMCENCKEKTCYDYRSEEACETDNCGHGGLNVNEKTGENSPCEWMYLWEEFGKGICYDKDFAGDKCSMCGPDADLFFNTNCDERVCDALGACYANSDNSACLSCVSSGVNKTVCGDYLSEQACTGGQGITFNDAGCSEKPIEIINSNDACGLGVCKWTGAKCIKDADDNFIDDCLGNPYPRDCNQDTQAPVTDPGFILPMGLFGSDITFTADSDAKTLYYCVGYETCCPRLQKGFTSAGVFATATLNPVFNLGDYTGPGIYYIRYYSVDKNNNVEEIKTTAFYIDKDAPTVTLSYVSQKVGTNLNLQIRLESDEYITCTYVMNPNPGNPIKNTFGLQDMVFELEYQNILDINYDLTTICFDSVGNEVQKTWNLFSPFNITILKGGKPISEVSLGDFTLEVRTKDPFSSMQVDYNFMGSQDIQVGGQISMVKQADILLWRGTFNIPSNANTRDVLDLFTLQIEGTDTDGNTHKITNTDYSINTIGPAIWFEPADIGPSKVYYPTYSIKGKTEPSATVYVDLYECTSENNCELVPRQTYSQVAFADMTPEGLIDKAISLCPGKTLYPMLGEDTICFNGDLRSTDGFNPLSTDDYYLEFSPPHGIRYKITSFQVSSLGGTTTFIQFSPPLILPLFAGNTVTTYTTDQTPGQFDIPIELSEGLNLLQIHAEKDGRIGDYNYHFVNYSTDGLNIHQILPEFGTIIYENLPIIILSVTTDFPATCNITHQGNGVAQAFLEPMQSSNGGMLHTFTFDSTQCAEPVAYGSFCYVNNDASTQGGVYHRYSVECSPDGIAMPSSEKDICFGVRTWYKLGTTEYGNNICDGATGCFGTMPTGCAALNCTPSCVGRSCGNDGCGGSCGSCGPSQICSGGNCIVCTPSCTGKECGSDGCTGNCGECSEGLSCENGQCVISMGGPGAVHD